MREGARPHLRAVVVRQVPSLAVLAVVAAGLAVSSRGYWRTGAATVGLGLLLAGALRLALSSRAAGWLVVRSRALDSALLLLVGLAVLVLAVTIPHPG